MSKSLMQLEKCCMDYLEIKTRETASDRDNSEKDVVREVKISFDLLNNEDKSCFLVPIRIVITSPDDSEDIFEKVEIGLKGIFSFPDGTGEEEVKRYVPLLCLTNLFGIARGIVAQATGLCQEGPFILPLVNMNELVRDYIKETEKNKSNSDEENGG